MVEGKSDAALHKAFSMVAARERGRGVIVPIQQQSAPACGRRPDLYCGPKRYFA
jgi:hypothetical protein